MKFLMLFLFSTSLWAQSNVSSGYAPLGYVYYDRYFQEVNQTLNTDESACPTIAIDDYRDGFKVSKIAPYSIQLGVGKGWWFEVPGGWVSVGLAFNKESYIQFFYESTSEEDLKRERKRKIPKKAQEIMSWDKGEAIYFYSTGGIVISAGAGMTPYMLGLSTAIKGSWSHYIEKTKEDNTIYINMTRRKIYEISVGNGISQIGAAKGWARENSKGFSYELKLEKDDVIEAYEKMLDGDFRDIEFLASQERDDVKKLDDIERMKKRNYYYVDFGTPFVPIIFFGAGASRDYEHSDLETTWEAWDKTDIGQYESYSSVRLVHKHRRASKKFQIKRKQESFRDWSNGGVRVEKTNYAASWQYDFESDLGNYKPLRRVVDRLISKTNLKDLLCVNIPKVEDNIKYKQLKFEFNLSDNYVRNLVQNTALVEMLESKTNKSFDEKFSARKSHNEFCRSDESVSECYEKNKRSIRFSFKKIKKYLKRAKKAFENDQEEFSKNMTKLGKSLWQNSDVFEAFFKVAKVCGGSYRYEVSGRRLSKHLREDSWETTENCPVQ